MDKLFSLRKQLDPVVDAVRIRPLARFVFRHLLRLRYGTNGVAVTRQNDRTLKLHTDVALRDEFYEFNTVLWLRRVIRAGDTVIDVGANVGQITLEAAMLTGPAGKVIAIEPAAGNLALLNRHIQVNQVADWVDVVVAACGAEHNSTAQFYILGDDPNAIGAGFTLKRDALAKSPTTSQVVKVVSIDGLCRDLEIAPTAIKIDVEGGEADVLKGAGEVLRKYRPHLFFAFHPFAFADPTAATSEIRKLLDDCEYDTPEPMPAGCYELAEYEAIPRERARSPTPGN